VKKENASINQRIEALEDEIAEQVSGLIEENIDIDLRILRFIKEDFHTLQKLADDEGLPFLSVVSIALGGIKKALQKDGRIGAGKIKEILSKSEKELKKHQ